MSHTTIFGKTTFIHSSDFDGDVTVIRGDQTINLPIEDFQFFVAEALRSKMMKIIQEATPLEVLFSNFHRGRRE